MKKTYTYRIYELNFVSTLELPNLGGALQSDALIPDVIIREGAIPNQLSDVNYHQEWDIMNYSIGTYQGQAATLIHFKQVGHFLIIAGKEIRFNRQADDHLGDFHSYLCSMAMVAILYQRGDMVLHASAVATPVGGLLFFGESGAGKTTTTAGFAQRGYHILTEDVTVVRLQDGVPYVLPGIPYLKLEHFTTQLIGFDWEAMPPLFSDNPKRAHLLDANYQRQAVPLRHIYQLSKDKNSSDLVFNTAIAYEERLGIVADNIHYKRFFMGYPLDEIYSELAIFLIENVPMTQVRRPAQQNTLQIWLDRLEAAFVEVG